MAKVNKTSTRAPKSLDKEKIKIETDMLVQRIGELQKIFYASAQHGLLVVLQGLDAAGKDGLISKVFKGINPLGCTVHAFKGPTEEEMKHDFLWRVHKEIPAKGMIQIFNRSHYEDVLITRVEKWIDDKTAKKRFVHINNFEDLITDNGTIVLKFYLHISREEQASRLTERKTNPQKYWKHNDDDWKTNQKWHAYMEAYEDIFKYCNNPEWTIVPADQNWYKEYIVAKKICDTLEKLKLQYPKMAKK
ncbi:MAG TPA: PPK2 family polyphosphate kinase [Cytophagaceae bacterium]|jgi:PPK2 family polyphosphate:nucleotide phosphotransferase|nr:PPK2 family polyphosphate kinase [Cytophagaceae bacterium]